MRKEEEEDAKLNDLIHLFYNVWILYGNLLLWLLNIVY